MGITKIGRIYPRARWISCGKAVDDRVDEPLHSLGRLCARTCAEPGYVSVYKAVDNPCIGQGQAVIKRSIWKVANVAGLAISLGLVGSHASAQIGAPQPINTPVQDQWRGPFEQFLREFGVKDQSAMLGKTNAFQIGGAWYPDSILFRIEDPSVCADDVCFTVIGRVIDNKFHVDTMFAAGKRFTRSDHFVPLFGFQTLPAWLVSDRITVTLLETPRGWIVTSSPGRIGFTP